MFKAHSGSPIPRSQIFVLNDGNIAIQWAEQYVQDLLTGAYRDYTPADFGHWVSDTELAQLKTSGVVEEYDQAYVWLYALPEHHNFDMLRTLQQSSNRIRRYYINTTLASSQLDELQQRFDALDLAAQFSALEHEGLIAILDQDSMPFANLKDAEKVQRKLRKSLPDLLENAVVAFTEFGNDLAVAGDGSDDFIDLDLLIASQTDTTVTRGKLAVIACKDDQERHEIMEVLNALEMAVASVQTAQETLNLLEEESVDLLVMDVKLEDMHGWAMLGKLREISHAAHTRVIVLAEQEADEQVFALTVAKVDAYLLKPLNLRLLRQHVWTLLKENAAQ